MTSQNRPPPMLLPPNAIITRVWEPADGPDVLAEIIQSVIASDGAIIAQIPAMAFTADDLTDAGARATQPERVA